MTVVSSKRLLRGKGIYSQHVTGARNDAAAETFPSPPSVALLLCLDYFSSAALADFTSFFAISGAAAWKIFQAFR